MSSPNNPQSSNNWKKRGPKKFGNWPSQKKLQYILDLQRNLDTLPVEPKLPLHERLVKAFGKDKVEEWRRNAVK